MPRNINPAQGYIVTANNRPVGADYPYYISMDFAPGYRAMRVTHGVESISGAAANDMGRIHAERVSDPGETPTWLRFPTCLCRKTPLLLPR